MTVAKMVTFKVFLALNFYIENVACVPCLFGAISVLAGAKVLRVLHSTCAGDLEVTEVEGRRSIRLSQLRPFGFRTDKVVGISLYDDIRPVGKIR